MQFNMELIWKRTSASKYALLFYQAQTKQIYYFTQNLSMLSKDNNKVDGQSSKSEIIFVLWKASHERFIKISFEKHYSIL